MKIRVIGILLCLCFMGGLTFHMTQRPWTQDESMYMLTAKMPRTEGMLPYRDFSYRQMPLYPMLLSGWQMVFGDDLRMNRLLSLLSIIGICGLALRFFKYGVLITLLFLSNPLIWDYFILVKPFALSTLFCVVGIGLLNRKKFLLSGVFLGAAPMIRLLYGALLLPFAWVQSRFKPKLVFGAAIVSLPAFFALLFERDRFLFNVLGFHSKKSLSSKTYSFEPVFKQISNVLADPAQLFLFFGFILAAVCVAREILRKSEHRGQQLFWLVAGPCIVIPSFMLRPFYDEYIASGIPFAAIIIGVVLFYVQDRNWRRGLIFCSSAAILFGAYANVKTLRQDVRLYKEEIRPMNSIASVEKVGEKIAQFTRKGDRVLSVWSGYALVANRPLMRGVETGLVVMEMAGRLTEEEGAKYRIATPSRFAQMIQSREPKLIVVGILADDPRLAGLEERVASRYPRVEVVEGVRLYIRD